MNEKGRSKKEIRRDLWLEDPRCHWCKNETLWVEVPGGALPPNGATLDHLYTRYEMEKRRAFGNPFVLSCNKCNHDLGEEATRAQPIEELWRRAGQWQRMVQEGRINVTQN